MPAPISPGPWKIIRRSDLHDVCPPEFDAVISIEDAEGFLVFFTNNGQFLPVEADAQAIVAVPEMVTVLREVFAHSKGPNTLPPGLDKRVEAVLARVEGKQS